MARNAAFFSRVLADIFPGKPAAPTSTPTPATSSTQSTVPAAAPVADTPPRVIGQGASDETLITIVDEPNLFVEEANCVVQFKPAFDEQASQTQFGLKILPELAPHWSQFHIHRCSLKEAIATAIRSAGKPLPTAPAAAPAASELFEAAQPLPADSASDGATARRALPRREHSHDTAAVEGRVVSWGEEKFPDRKSVGASRFYTSFAMHIDTVAGERTLQGEGLKEAIAESGCLVGDYVSVRRLRKIKVPAIRRDGSPKIVDGKQVMWDKWLWSISE
jgi:hypothetical protein